MTTFQNPPHQSRREVRQSERDEAPQPEPVADEASLNLPTAPSVAPPASGRRARTGDIPGLVQVPSSPPELVEPASAAPAAEPLDYATRGGPQVPAYDGPSFSTNPDPASSQSGDQGYRVRDFSPEGRRAAINNEPGSHAQGWTPPPREQQPSPLDYHTLAGPPAGAVPQQPAFVQPTFVESAEHAPVVAAAATQHAVPVEPLAADSFVAPEHTLTRRELRALRERQDAASPAQSEEAAVSAAAPAVAEPVAAEPIAAWPVAEVTPEPAVPPLVPPLVEPEAAPSTATALANAMAEFEALTRAAQEKSAPLLAAQQPESEQRVEPEHFTAAPKPAPIISFQQQAPLAWAEPSPEPIVEEPQVPVDEDAMAGAGATGDTAINDFAALFAQPEPTQPEAAQPEAAPENSPFSAMAFDSAEPAASDSSQASTFDFLLNPTAPAKPAAEVPAEAVTPIVEPVAEFAPEPSPVESIPAQPSAAATEPAPFPFIRPEPQASAEELNSQLSPQFVEPELTTGSFATTTGHWSNQAGIDEEEIFENTLSRELGRANTTTTNALVLPVTSQHGDFAASLNATGEILATGSINLPEGFGSRGGDARRYDDPDVDHLFDAFDNEIISTDSAPVRAIRSVSTQTATRGVIHSNKSNGNRMLTVLLVTGCVMAVAVGALLVAGFVFRIF